MPSPTGTPRPERKGAAEFSLHHAPEERLRQLPKAETGLELCPGGLAEVHFETGQFRYHSLRGELGFVRVGPSRFSLISLELRFLFLAAAGTGSGLERGGTFVALIVPQSSSEAQTKCLTAAARLP